MKLIKPLETLLITGAAAFTLAGEDIKLINSEGNTSYANLEKGDSTIYIKGKYFLKKPSSMEWHMIKDGFSSIDTNTLKEYDGVLLVYSPVHPGLRIDGPLKLSDYRVAIPQPDYLENSDRVNQLFNKPERTKHKKEKQRNEI